MEPFTRNVIRVIQGIPEGSVMTYGQIAAAAGSRRGARQVVRVLHSMSEKHRLPWHRVVNARGEIAIGDAVLRAMQMELLEEEGVHIGKEGTVDLATFRFEPVPEEGD